jgi:flavodoxin
VYESKYGNGKKCVDHLQDVLKEKGHDVETFPVREIQPGSLPQADLYFFSSPTHIGGPTRRMKKFLKKLEMKRKGTKYALMTTYLYPNTKTLQIMDDILKSKGMTWCLDGLKIKVDGIKGPLETGYREKIHDFVKNVLDSK